MTPGPVVVLIFVLISIILNILYFWLGIYGNAYTYNGNGFLLPPGFVIGIVWVVVFGILGYVYWDLIDKNNDESSFASVFVIIFAIWCALYPLLVNGSNKLARLFNFITLILVHILGILVVGQCYSNDAALTPFWVLIVPMVWIFYVNITDVVYMNFVAKCYD